MKAILLTRTGDPSVLDYVDVPTPRPQAGEVLVKADTIGVSRPELLVRRRHLQMDAAAPHDPRHRNGRHRRRARRRRDRLSTSGKRSMSARASCRSAPAATPNTSRCRGARCASCRRTSISKRRRASPTIRSPIICCTPRRAACPGKTALIDVASGGLGSAAVQLAKLAGMTAIGLVGSDEKARALEGLRRRPRHQLLAPKMLRRASPRSPAARESISCSMPPAAKA